MTIKTVYKAVRQRKNGKYHSVVVNNRLDTNYEIGVKTVPPVGFLFAFEDIESAKDFIATDEVILVCRALTEDNQKKLPERISHFQCSVREMREFWNKSFTNSECSLMKIPDGTVFCKWITPLRIWNESTE